MEYKDYIKLITQKTIKPICVMYGEEQYVKDSVIERLKKAFVDPFMLEFDMNVFDIPSATYDNVLFAVNSPAMISERRLILISQKPESALIKDEKFVSLCESLDDSVLLVINIDGKPDKRLNTIKKLEAASDFVSFEALEKTDIIKWIVQHFKANGKRITPGDAEYLVSLAGEDLFALQSEIGKLSDCHEEEAVTRKDIEEMVAHTPEHGVFALVDAVAAKKTAEAVKQTGLLLSDGTGAFQLLALVERQYQLILQYINYINNGVPQKDIMQKLALKPFVHDKIRRQASGYTLDTCKLALQKCLELDYAVKSGKADAETEFELLVIKLCNI